MSAAAPRAAPETVDGLMERAVAAAGGGSGPGLQCPLCGVAIRRRSNLRRHLAQQHLNQRPHRCRFPGCEARFARKADLEKHVRTHTGVRPYQCDKCGRAFRCSSELYAHRRTHTPLERRFFCPVPRCSKSFLRRYSLRTHLVGHGLTPDAARAEAAAAEPKRAQDATDLPDVANAATAAADPDSSRGPSATAAAAAPAAARAYHRHGINCGHVIVRHGDHVDVVDRGILWELDLATGAAMRPHGPRRGSEDRKRPRPEPCPVHGATLHADARRAKLPPPAQPLPPPGEEEKMEGPTPSTPPGPSLPPPLPHTHVPPEPTCPAATDAFPAQADVAAAAAAVDVAMEAGSCSCWPDDESVGLLSPLGPCGQPLDALAGEALEPLTEDDLLILQVAARARQRGLSEELSRFPQ